MQILFKPSNIPVRVIYCLCLLFVGLTFLRGLNNLLSLLATPDQLSIMNIMVGVVPNLTPAIMFFLVLFRFFGVATGKFKLNVFACSGGLYILRIIAILLMALSVFPWFFSLAGAMIFSGHDGVGFAFLLGSLGGGATAGILLFEASRLLERELLVEKT